MTIQVVDKSGNPVNPSEVVIPQDNPIYLIMEDYYATHST